MSGFEQFQRVRITAIKRRFELSECFPGTRLPQAGDIATIVEIYRKPGTGYELECVNQRSGETEWLLSVAQSDLELEAVDE